jgi:hypothetical protein
LEVLPSCNYRAHLSARRRGVPAPHSLARRPSGPRVL